MNLPVTAESHESQSSRPCPRPVSLKVRFPFPTFSPYMVPSERDPARVVRQGQRFD
ncbi:hypothetical protein PSP6_630073 [Paraburkholderia tropica]|nr:hypothetical protein PSP6_630073 [Paraburkholderia tropica]